MIALHYLKSWFVLDLVSVLPLGIVLGGTSSGSNLSKVAKMYRLIKLTNISRIF